jgi:hypothetical protein
MSKCAYLFPPQDTVDSRIKLLKWAPQEAMLRHPAVKLFVTHCGAESVHEVVFAGKPVVAMPLFADQPGNAAKLVDAGVGEMIHKLALSPQLLVDKVTTVVQDKDGKYASNVRRLKAIAHMSHYNGKRRAADLIELEAEWGHEHLIPATTKMSFIKGNNLDIYVPLAVAIFAVLFFQVKLISHFLFSKSSQASVSKYKKRN